MGNQVWRHIDETGVSASYGLASDEYLMQSHCHSDTAYPATLKLYTYRNSCVLCGRFQDIQAEIDIAKCTTQNFDYGRRLTGGGAIIMGEDQLGICLATHTSIFAWTHIRELYELFSGPILNALRDFGIAASFRSKNDLEVDGKKIAGLGIHINPDGGIQFHSSLLLDLDIPMMLTALKIPVQKFADKKMTHSIEQRMTTVRKEAQEMVRMDQLKDAILRGYQGMLGASFKKVPFSASELIQIEKLEHDRYQSEAWLFQHSPQEDIDGMSLKKTAAGLLRTYIGLKGETIKSVMITGDFMERPASFSRIESSLKWSALDRNRISQIVQQAFEADSDSNIGIKPDELTAAIWLAAQRAIASVRYIYKGSCYYPKENAMPGEIAGSLIPRKL